MWTGPACTLLNLCNRRLLDSEQFGQHLLRQSARFAKFVQWHFCQHRLRLGVGARQRFRLHLGPQVCKFLSNRLAIPFEVPQGNRANAGRQPSRWCRTNRRFIFCRYQPTGLLCSRLQRHRQTKTLHSTHGLAPHARKISISRQHQRIQLTGPYFVSEPGVWSCITAFRRANCFHASSQPLLPKTRTNL